MTGDVLDWEPNRKYDVWHDRAVFHFQTEQDAQQRYVALASRDPCQRGPILHLDRSAPQVVGGDELSPRS